jgi:hypothetical protein
MEALSYGQGDNHPHMRVIYKVMFFLVIEMRKIKHIKKTLHLLK